MTFKLKKSLLLTALAATAALPVFSANAGGTISFGEDKSVSVGLGMRSSFTSTEDGATNGTSRSNDFALDSMRLYMNASLNKYIKGTFNTEKKVGVAGEDSVAVIDAIAQFEFMPEFNIWAGRMLPGSDRANLDGPYYLLAWEYPGVVSRYPSKTTGRDDGVAVWGKLLDGRLIYNAGTYEGHYLGGNPPNSSDSLLYAGRLQYDFWEPNGAPAFYTGSTTFGTADVLSIGIAAQYQKDGAVGVKVGDYTGWNIDALMEKKLGVGAVTLEGAYYKYDTDGAIASEDGKAYLAGIAYIFNDKVGWGQFQPYFRYQKFDPDTNIQTKQYDYGVNYILDSFNAKLSATYSQKEVTAAADVDKFVVGVQLQF